MVVNFQLLNKAAYKTDIIFLRFEIEGLGIGGIQMNDEQFEGACNSSGLWFVGMYMEAFLLRLDELEDKNLKSKLIEEIYDNGENTFDKKIGGTRTRVNSLYRIITGNRVVDALESVIKSDRVSKENPQAITDAQDLLKKIEKGEISVYERCMG